MKETIPLKRRAASLGGDALAQLVAKLGAGWQVVDHRYLVKSYSFPDFNTALAYVNKVGQLAEQVNHHPQIILSWGRVEIRLWTERVGGLSEIDFAFATRADAFAQ
jgi:4a-hydroxytetrahydrobiopterin dehydratase